MLPVIGKNHTPPQKKETNSRLAFSIRVNLFFFSTFLLFSALIVKLAILQFVEGKELAAQEKLNSKADITISPIRGNIYDLDAFPIAYTVSAQSLFYKIEPGQKQDEMIALAVRLADILAAFGDAKGEMPDAAEIIKRMDVGFDLAGEKTKDPSYTFQPRRIKAGLSDKEIAYLTEHRDELKGTEIVEESTRMYDSTPVASQLVGYLRPFSTARNQQQSWLDIYKDHPEDYLNEEFVGFDGLEYMYQEDLRGRKGSKTYPVNSRSQIIGQVNLTPPEKGHNLFLTLKKDVQIAAQQAIKDQLEMLHASQNDGTYYYLGKNAVAGYAVAMEVDTGRVVAMANYPDYDPNVWASGRISDADWSAIQYRYTNGTIRERLPDIADDKERGKHPSSLVPLGSTMKPLTVLVGLNEGVLGINERYNDPATFYYGKDGSNISNSDKHSYGTLTPALAIQKSANTFMAEMIGDRMYKSSEYAPYKSGSKGIGSVVDVWDDYMKKFGLGSPGGTGSGLPGESSGFIEYYHTADNSSAQAAMVFASFGQMGRYTPLQLVQYASMLANRGQRYKPQFVDRITTYDGQLVRKVEPELLGEVEFPDAYWDVLEQGMKEVFVQGFDGTSYSHARKTGTSQQQVGSQLLENAVFIAYAPIEKPKLAVAVVVPEGGYGSWGAAPIARKIFDAYDKHVGLNGVPKG